MTGDVDTQESHDRTWRDIRHCAYVDRPFAEVCRLLAEEPARVLGDSGDGGVVREQRAGLHVRRAGVDVSRDVRILRGDLLLDEDAARLPLRWEDAERPNLFPVLEATLELVPVPAGRRPTTQVGLAGRYRPPFGRLGAVADTLAGEFEVAIGAHCFTLDDGRWTPAWRSAVRAKRYEGPLRGTFDP